MLSYLHALHHVKIFPKLQLRKKDLEPILDLLSKNESCLVNPLDEHACTRSLWYYTIGSKKQCKTNVSRIRGRIRRLTQDC